ncbi:uncharacterized protein BX664DRAFT_333539 [Halteromyces radiatus]|uniref:uncharacterized protein n=1 Tax=Halteromyces radiatus TaxID=101107 RepID=UPI00221EF2A0|nr:uncharacterized protein BX664DRAFT_333539 [Halteromyces radiatus]KAI8089640.1 hypothetical protein BX664DRAFT_333539 [Halteromyces radiatus]
MSTVPIPMQEAPILEKLISIRHRLSALKKDRDSYPKAEDIISLYQQTEQQVELLATCRSGDVWSSKNRNRVNDVLDDVMSLLSLFFMTIGRNREYPAVYAQLVTVERYLDQLNQMGIYTDRVLVEIEERLEDIGSIIYEDRDQPDDHPTYFLDLLKKKYTKSKDALDSLLSTIRKVSPELKPLQDDLVELRRQLAMVAQRPCGFKASDIYPFQEKLRQIDNLKSDLFPKDGSVPNGQALIVGLLEQLYEETHDLIASTDNISDSLKPIADRLKEIKAQLERLALTHRWTLRETDLYTFQLQLQEIEKLRHNGKFRDPQAGEDNVPDGQALINFLLRGCYRLITKMLSENVPVSEAIMPIHNQLSTVRRCLLEVTKWGKPDSARDLYPYQLKLASIDNMRQNGIFYDDEGNIPEGQAICIALLNECYDILHDLMAAVDDGERTT